MPDSKDIKKVPTPEEQLFEFISSKDLKNIVELLNNNPDIDLNCIDKDELSPLQHACHIGDLELAKYLLKFGSKANFTKRKDGYTPLMFAAIGGRTDIVRLLLEYGADTQVENCVNRTAAQMAAFVGQTKVVLIINRWTSFEDSVKPYTKCLEFEDKPRISSDDLAHLLHEYIIYPSLHPIKFLLFIKDNSRIVEHSKEVIYVLENLSSKYSRPPLSDDSISFKYHYLSYLVNYCRKLYQSKLENNKSDEFEKRLCDKTLETALRRLIKQSNPNERKACTKLMDQLIIECIMKFPYIHSAIFKTMTFALQKSTSDESSALSVLIQSLDGPKMFGLPEGACSVCEEVERKGKRCSKCKSVFYCGPSCQRIDWFQHRKVCN